MNTAKLLTIFVVPVLLAGGCGMSDDSGKNAAAPEDNGIDGPVYQFRNCEELKEYLVKTAVDQADLQMSQDAYYFAVDGVMEGGDMATDDDAADFGGDVAAPTANGADSAESDGGGRDYSTTNTQEEGVDEADFVKNDGDYIYLLTGGQFMVFDAWPADETVELSRTEVEGEPFSMYVGENVAVVFSNMWVDYYYYADYGGGGVSDPGVDVAEPAPATSGSAGGKLAASQSDEPQFIADGFIPRGWNVTKVTVLDISDKAAPALRREIYIEGGYTDSRMVDGNVYLVTNSYIELLEVWYEIENEYYEEVYSDYDYDDDSAASEAEFETAVDELLVRYEEQLNELELDEMLPRYYDVKYNDDGTVKSSDIICSCDNFFRPAIPNGRGAVSLVTIDMSDARSDMQNVALLTDNGTVYGSEDAIYLATVNNDYWMWWGVAEDEDPSQTTVIHKFDLGAKPEYVASGEVEGWVLNQFAMSEYQGALRVATTENQWWSDEEESNNVYVMMQDGGLLNITGHVDNIAPTETIYAVRFLAERGFVVTFEQIDPLFTLDLADPYNPVLVGELEVPGFSTYLHPLGQNHLLAIGQNTDTWGVDLSIFDVSDFANPVLADRYTVGAGSYSEAQYNHKAFNYFASRGILALPMTTYTGDFYYMDTMDVFTGLHVYNIDIETGITLDGRIDHADFYRDDQYNTWYWPESVRRSVIIEDVIYSISPRGLKVTSLDDLSLDYATLDLPVEYDMYWTDYYGVDDIMLDR